MTIIIKVIFIFTLTFGANNVFSQGIDLDVRVTIQAGFCEDGGLGSIEAFKFLEKTAVLELLEKAKSHCRADESAELMNNIGQKDIKKTISKINIKGCQETVYNDFLAEASSGFICI